MISSLNWLSLQDRRLHSRLVMMYKIHHDLVDIKAEDYLTGHKASKHYELRGHKSRYHRSYTDASAYSTSFFPKTIRDWNSFPGDPASYTSLDAFKTALRGLQSHLNHPVFTCTLYIMHPVHLLVVLEMTHVPTAV